MFFKIFKFIGYPLGLSSRYRLPLLLTATLLLTSCSGVSLVYSQLDRASNWYINRQVSLEPAQKDRLRAELNSFWSWHCRTQLDPYASWLRQLANEFDNAQFTEELSVPKRHTDGRICVEQSREDGERGCVTAIFIANDCETPVSRVSRRVHSIANSSADRVPQNVSTG